MLTDKAIIQARPKEKLYRISDQSGNGLSLEVSPQGGKRWRFRYRYHGTPKMVSLGVCRTSFLFKCPKKPTELKEKQKCEPICMETALLDL
ncbi:MAG: Arm DNA-binding domain-containing protein [Desulfovibrio sp.]|jgi:hypothetical protein|nr:Arm DNA-binding domain-containing protein [Desulfovibrio sp.]